MLPVSTAVMLQEMETLKTIVDKWTEKVAQGVPGVDVPMTGNTGERLELWLTELVGELRFVSGKAANLADVLSHTLLE